MKAPLPEDESVCLFCIGKLIAVMDKHEQDSNSDISLATMTAFLLALQRNFGEENKLDNEIIEKEAHSDETPFEVGIGGDGLVVDTGLSGVQDVQEGIQSIGLIIAPDVLPDQSESEGADAEHGVACVGVFGVQEVPAKARTIARTRTDDELRIAFGLPVHEHGVNEATTEIYKSDLQEKEKEIENEAVLTNAIEVEVEACAGPSCALPEPNGIPVIIETSDVTMGEVKTADSAAPELTSAASVDPLRSMVHLIPTVMIALFILLFLLLDCCSALSSFLILLDVD